MEVDGGGDVAGVVELGERDRLAVPAALDGGPDEEMRLAVPWSAPLPFSAGRRPNSEVVMTMTRGAALPRSVNRPAMPASRSARSAGWRWASPSWTSKSTVLCP
jgi:hypothetical protein